MAYRGVGRYPLFGLLNTRSYYEQEIKKRSHSFVLQLFTPSGINHLTFRGGANALSRNFSFAKF